MMTKTVRSETKKMACKRMLKGEMVVVRRFQSMFLREIRMVKVHQEEAVKKVLLLQVF